MNRLWSPPDPPLYRPFNTPLHFKLLIAFLSLNPLLIGLCRPHISAFISRWETVLPRLEIKSKWEKKKKKKREKSVCYSLGLIFPCICVHLWGPVFSATDQLDISSFLRFLFRLSVTFIYGAIIIVMLLPSDVDSAAVAAHFIAPCGHLYTPHAYLIKFQLFQFRKVDHRCVSKNDSPSLPVEPGQTPSHQQASNVKKQGCQSKYILYWLLLKKKNKI